MRHKALIRLISLVLVTAMCAATPAGILQVLAEENPQYVSDVFIAYGKDEEEAGKWLTDNGWEPVGGDLNAGKTSGTAGSPVAAVMGIRRTDDPYEAVTDMATMNMTGGYSFDDYESLVTKKKADITGFIYTFSPLLEEYRTNYNGKGSEGGQKRAQYAHDLLNKFFDGDPDGVYARNDTGRPLGDLLLNKTRAELGEAAYSKLSETEKKQTADFQQIILESSGLAVITVEQALAFAADAGNDTWLDRMDQLTGDNLKKNVAKYCPEAQGKKLTNITAMNYLNAHFGNAANKLAVQWRQVNEDIVWYEKYCEMNSIGRTQEESDDGYGNRLDRYFADLKAADEEEYHKVHDRFFSVGSYYGILSKVGYAGSWGTTLYDFFRDKEQKDFGSDFRNFLPLAAVLSDGQRAGLDLIPLSILLRLGTGSNDVMKAAFPALENIFTDSFSDSISVYSGINRAVFRNGVALTNDALMKKYAGDDPYENIWDGDSIVNITAYSMLGIGAVSLATGAGMAVKAACQMVPLAEEAAGLTDRVQTWTNAVQNTAGDAQYANRVLYESGIVTAAGILEDVFKAFGEVQDKMAPVEKTANAVRRVMGIGGAMMMITSVLLGAQIGQLYNRTFTPIPMLMVDEDDIVSCSFDRTGKKMNTIRFNQYIYYEAVKCNRQSAGIPVNAKGGVSDYASWGCGDAADLNCDVGKQWLALYLNRSADRGYPILADSITVQYGDSTAPKDYKGKLHMFSGTDAVDIGDTVYTYGNDKKGIYLFWKSDEKAYDPVTAVKDETEKEPRSTAVLSTFTGGSIALAALCGILAGVLGTTIAILPKRKKETESGNTTINF